MNRLLSDDQQKSENPNNKSFLSCSSDSNYRQLKNINQKQKPCIEEIQQQPLKDYQQIKNRYLIYNKGIQKNFQNNLRFNEKNFKNNSFSHSENTSNNNLNKKFTRIQLNQLDQAIDQNNKQQINQQDYNSINNFNFFQYYKQNYEVTNNQKQQREYFLINSQKSLRSLSHSQYSTNKQIQPQDHIDTKKSQQLYKKLKILFENTKNGKDK
ncbi:hypothetical protein PPERSA_09979 [Pseudocohnilembus persalinus]|uniref:Uncharacterized protein n=1 Tax=Pseudocohnilembus persalinus TaxID=266149 RepID=A0A0V0QJV2_PSEPJ|nr:hypothetical protein PPERSA_09979 [Pseudocohnilembus persalinus]|eukprot:KRX02362.1 hypothetical protein PPERSA_09979 [Pseudocohnilembus persalinus]